MGIKRARGCLLSLAVLLAMLTILWITRGWILPAMGRWLDVGVPPQRADYVMILNGDENTRPFAAAALIKSGWAAHALMSQVRPLPGKVENDRFSSNVLIRQVLLQRGVPEEKITLLPGSAATTFDEALSLATFLESHPGAKVLIVTNHFHTRRARWIFARTLPSSVEFSMISVPCETFDLNTWWKTEYGWTSVSSEYFKLAFYSVYYGYYGILFLVLFCGFVGMFIWQRIRKRRILKQTTAPLGSSS
jgi:uncharacterized SAM-binding protein YcdF (DUF218 family)